MSPLPFECIQQRGGESMNIDTTAYTTRLLKAKHDTDLVSGTHVETARAFRVQLSAISNYRSDDQRKLRTLIFLSDDHRNQDPRAGRSDVLPFRDREAELSDEGHQERLGLRDAVTKRCYIHSSI